MLTPDQLAHCADDILKLYSQLEEEIVRDVARRISKTGVITETGKLQLNAMQELGTLNSDILKSLSKYTDKTEEQLQKLFEDAAVTATEYDNEIYRANGLNPKSIKVSATQMQTLEAGYKKTSGNLSNLTRTTAVTSQTGFINACTLAEMKAESGAFSPQQAIVDAIKQVASEGAFVLYPSGHRDRLDVAVRRNVMTGIGQTTGEICLANARELGCDLMEITAHAGARPSHASWQGQIVSLSGRKGYLSLSDIGYGTGDGFKGWNCRHDWFPYFEGSTRMYSEKDLKELDAENIEFPDGSMHTLYEAEQYQRALERRIRQTKRTLAACDEALNNLSDEELLNNLQKEFNWHSKKLKRQESELNAFCRKTDLLPDNSRTQVAGFGKSTSQKAVWANKKSVAKSSKKSIIKSLDADDFTIMSGSHNILPEVADVISGVINEYESRLDLFISDMVFGDFIDPITGKPALLQIDMNKYGLLVINVNSSLLGNKTLAEVDEMIKNIKINLPDSLREAVIHECGHAKAYKGKSAQQISAMNKAISDKGVKGISEIAESDGAECIAEVEVLLSRNSYIPPKAKVLYDICVNPNKIKVSNKKYNGRIKK